jgi:hypothetical protein
MLEITDELAAVFVLGTGRGDGIVLLEDVAGGEPGEIAHAVLEVTPASGPATEPSLEGVEVI